MKNNRLEINLCVCTQLFAEGISSLIREALFDRELQFHVCPDSCQLFGNHPDILILDYTVLSATCHEELVEQNVPTLLVGTYCLPLFNNEYLLSLFQKGLAGILTPVAGREDLVAAVERIVAGEILFSRERLRELLLMPSSVSSSDEEKLTPREMEVVRLICRGFRNKEIMGSLNISEQSVKSHLIRTIKKFGVNDRLQLALHAVRRWPNYLYDL